jgi:hypothetical protein
MIIIIRLLIAGILILDALTSWGLIEHGNGLSNTVSLEWTGCAAGLALGLLIRTFHHR